MAGIAVDEVGLIPDDGDLGFEIPEDEEGLLALANSGEYNSGGRHQKLTPWKRPVLSLKWNPWRIKSRSRNRPMPSGGPKRPKRG